MPAIIILFDLILYVPSTIFQLYRDASSWVEPVLSWDECVLLMDHNAVTPVRFEQSAIIMTKLTKQCAFSEKYEQPKHQSS